MFTTRRIAVKVCERLRSFSNSCVYDRRNFTKQYKHHVINNNTDLPPLLVNYGDGFLQMLTSSSLLGSAECIGRRPISVQFPSNFIVCGPCHGLFCLYSAKGAFALWNPATGDMKNLPSVEEEIEVQNVGFGFDSSVNDYKIVRYIICRRSCNYNFDPSKIIHKIQIYSLKGNRWRDIPVHGEIISYLPLLAPGSYASGACYWTLPSEYGPHSSGTRLIYFVFAEEEFHVDCLSGAVPYKNIACQLDTFNGFPAAICYDKPEYLCCCWDFPGEERETDTPYGSVASNRFQVWVWMRDNGVLTWVHQMEIGPFHDDDPIYTPLRFLRNRGLLMIDLTYHLVWYDFHANAVVRTDIYLLGRTERRTRKKEKAISSIQILNFPETLVTNQW